MFSEHPSRFIDNSSVGIHAVAADGTIVFANQHELEVLGYTEEEYVGRNASEFQMDEDVLADMLERLGRFENLKNYPARVRGKHETKYILYNSSVYHEGDEFIHTRCYAVDIEKHAYDVFKEFSPYFK